MCCDKVDSQKPACCIAQSVRHLLAVVPALLPPPLLRRHIWFLKDALSKNLIRILTINTSNESLFAHMLACTIPDLISWRTSCAVPSSIFDRWNNKGPRGGGADAAGSRTLTFCSAFGVCRRLSRRGSEDSPPLPSGSTARQYKSTRRFSLTDSFLSEWLTFLWTLVCVDDIVVERKKWALVVLGLLSPQQSAADNSVEI